MKDTLMGRWGAGHIYLYICGHNVRNDKQHEIWQRTNLDMYIY